MKKIFIHCNLPLSEKKKLKKKFRIKVHNADKEILSSKTFLKSASGFDGIISQGNVINREFIEKNKSSLKVISNVGVGYDNIDVTTASKHGIAVFNTPGILNNTVADMTIGLLLALTRKICEGNNYVKDKKWVGNSWPLFWGCDLNGESLGIVGMGNIGKEVAKRANSFGLKIFYNNRKKLNKEIEEKFNANYLSLNKLVERCKFIILLLPLNNESKHLFNKNIFKRMRKDAYIVNIARGKIIKEIDLVNALIDNDIAGAALDVFEFEPRVHKKLFKLKNVVLMPHAGSATLNTRNKMMNMACENISDYFLLKKSNNIVNKEVLNV